MSEHLQAIQLALVQIQIMEGIKASGDVSLASLQDDEGDEGFNADKKQESQERFVSLATLIRSFIIDETKNEVIQFLIEFLLRHFDRLLEYYVAWVASSPQPNQAASCER